VARREDGGYVRFHPTTTPDADADATEPCSTRAPLLDRIHDDPGVEQAEGAPKLGCSRQLVSYHARRLERDPGIRRSEDRGRKRLYPGEG
jgi:predicted transcriptional regulator